MKEKIIIYGMGFQYELYKDILNKDYEIEMLIDNSKHGEEIIDSVQFKKNPVFTLPVFIMSEKYFEEIKADLLEVGLSETMILNGVEICKQKVRQSEIENDPVGLSIQQMESVPLSRTFGLDRGKPLDRVYIEQFLEMNMQFIIGDCLEIADNSYTLQFGEGRIKNSYILHYTGENGTIKGDLVTGKGITPELVDCAIITQTMMFLKNPMLAAKNIYKVLKHGGNALITVSGISPISIFDHERWGHFYSFYDDGIHAIFDESFGKENIKITQYGNIKIALGFLYGMCAEDFKTEDFEVVDECFPILYGIVLHKE